MAGLERFTRAQDQPGAGFAAARSEIRAGRKQGHWIWYVFPQLSGLGHSEQARTYGIRGVSEAADYLRDPILRARLLAITSEVSTQLRHGISLVTLMGSSIDTLKLVSSLTLFGAIAGRLSVSDGADAYEPLAKVMNQVLDAAAAAGYPPCPFTLARLAKGA